MADPQTSKSEQQKYLETRHHQLVTPSEIIDQVVTTTLGWSSKSQERLIAGEINEVYKLTLKNDQVVMMRIFHGEEDEFEAEEWPVNQAAQAEVPIPKILAHESLEIEGQPRYFCIQEPIPGHSLDKRPIRPEAEDQEYLHQIINQAGALLSKIHQVKPSGFGPITSNGQTPYTTLTEMLAYGYELGRAKQALLKIKVESDIVNQAKAILDKHQPLLEKTQPTLVHGDFGPKHIMVEDDHITGIIDFGNAHGGDLAEDFAWWDIFYPPQAPLEWLIEGYENKAIFNDEFKTRLELQRIIRSLNLIRYYGETDRLGAVEKMHDQLEKGVKYFQ